MIGDLPFAATAGSASPTNLDLVLVAGATGVSASYTGGATWEDVSTTLFGIEFGPVAGVRAVPSPADDEVFFAITDSSDGTRVIQRSINSGESWDRLGDSTQIVIGDDARLYPSPDDPAMVLSQSGVPAESKLNIYVVTAGEGIHSVGVGGYQAMPQITIMGDRWVSAVY